jgi:hypothetical protein
VRLINVDSLLGLSSDSRGRGEIGVEVARNLLDARMLDRVSTLNVGGSDNRTVTMES